MAQSIIVQNNLILGVEAAEGTDNLIMRCSKYKKKGDKGILIKLSKYNQSSNLDVPVIGLENAQHHVFLDQPLDFIKALGAMAADLHERSP